MFAAMTVNNPVITRERLLMAPSISPILNAFAVPMAWEEVPSATPFAMGF